MIDYTAANTCQLVFAVISFFCGGWLSCYCFYMYYYFQSTQKSNFLSLFMIGSFALSTTLMMAMAILRYVYVWQNDSFCYFRLFCEVYGRNCCSMWSLSIGICLYLITIKYNSINNNSRNAHGTRRKISQSENRESGNKSNKNSKNSSRVGQSELWQVEKMDNFKSKSLLINSTLPLVPATLYCILIGMGLDGAHFKNDRDSQSNCAMPDEIDSRYFMIAQFTWDIIPCIVMLASLIIYYSILNFLYVSKYKSSLKTKDGYSHMNRFHYIRIRNYFLALLMYPILNFIISLLCFMGNAVPGLNTPTYWAWAFSISNLQGVLETIIFVFNNYTTVCTCFSSYSFRFPLNTNRDFTLSPKAKAEQTYEKNNHVVDDSSIMNYTTEEGYSYNNPINQTIQRGPHYTGDYSHNEIEETFQSVLSLYSESETYSESQIDLTLMGNSTLTN